MKHYLNNKIYNTGDTVIIDNIRYINCTNNWFKTHNAIEVVEIQDEGESGLYTVDEQGNRLEKYVGQSIKHTDTVLNEEGKEEDYIWEEPVPYKYFKFTKKVKASNIPTLEELKRNKIFEIEYYDCSSEVNDFIYKDKHLWIDKATRVGLVNAINAAKLINQKTITFGIDGLSVTMQLNDALLMLANLELYALDCYNITLKHKEEVNKLTTKEEIAEYDITKDYPNKLIF